MDEPDLFTKMRKSNPEMDAYAFMELFRYRPAPRTPRMQPTKAQPKTKK